MYTVVAVAVYVALSLASPPTPPSFDSITEEVWYFMDSMTNEELRGAINSGLFEAMGVHIPSDVIKAIASGGHIDMNELRQDLVGWVVDAIIEDSSGLGMNLLNGWEYVPGNSWRQAASSTVGASSTPNPVLAARTATQFWQTVPGIAPAAPRPSTWSGVSNDPLERALNDLIREIGDTISFAGDLFTGLARVMAESIQDAFTQIGNNMSQAQQTQVGSITVDGQTMTFNGVRYVANVRADYALLSNMQSGKYYPAMRYRGHIMVAPVAIDREVAKGIMAVNNPVVGVFTVGRSEAANLTNELGGAIPGTRHRDEPGYWRHYHFKIATTGEQSDSHAWYFR